MGLIAQSIRARGQRITLTDAQGGVRKVRGIVGFGGEDEQLSLGNQSPVPSLIATLAKEDAAGIERGYTLTFDGGTHKVNGVLPQGRVTALTLGDRQDEAA